MTDFVCEDDGFVRDADSFFMRMDAIYTLDFPELSHIVIPVKMGV